MDSSALTIFPDAPEGATMFSRYITYHHLSGNSSVNQTKHELFGKSIKAALDSFGEYVHLVRNRLPTNVRFNVADHIQKSTAFGFYAGALPEGQKDVWLHAHMSGEKPAINKFLYGPNRRFLKEHLHFCRGCVEEDGQSWGMAFWRVVHQIPGVHHCPTHLLPLHGVCNQCGLAQSSRTAWNMPSISCPHCGSPSFHARDVLLSPTYRTFLSLCASACAGDSIGISPESRLLTYRTTTNDPHKRRTHADAIKEMTLSRWSCDSLEDLEKQLEAPFNMPFITGALIGSEVIVNPVGHIALLAALKAENLSFGLFGTRSSYKSAISTEPLLDEEVLPAPYLPRYEQALSLTALHRLTEPVVKALLKGNSSNSIAKHFRISWHKVEALRKEIQRGGIIDYFANIEDQRVREFLAQDLPSSMSNPRRILNERKHHPNLNDREYHRMLVSRAIGKGARFREEVKQITSHALKWCRKHDSAWLTEILPAKTLPHVPREKKLETYRARILQYLRDNDSVTVTRLDKEVRGPYRWCARHDVEWLESAIAPYRTKAKRAVVKRRTKKDPPLEPLEVA
jgi:hypothetical protein